MSKGTLGQVVKRAISDAAFRRQLQSDPNGALTGFDLTSDERAALRSGDASKLSSLGVDQRMSKAFAMGEGASAVSKWGTGNDLAMGANVPDGGDGPLVNDALTSGGGGRASDALIGETSGAKGARISDAGGSVRLAVSDGDSAGAHSSLDVSGQTRDGSLIAPDAAGRQTGAFITADEQGNNVVAGGSAGAQSSLDVSGQTRDGSLITSDAAGRQTDAFITADEMGNDASALGHASYPDSADTQREALANDAAMANPEGYTKPDLDA